MDGVHITYADVLDRESLQQGDVLLRTPAIDSMLRDVHPHYTKDDYRYLMVLTQTCDLVRRVGSGAEKRCKARYLSVAAVRPFDRVLERELAKYQRSTIERQHRLCESVHRERLEQFVARLLNNNEEEFFYLHPHQYADAPAGLMEPCCAFLTLSIALKSELHYDKCLEAKILQLNDSFQHKLGWLVGKMYSRVGTADWVPDVCNQEEFEKLVTGTVNSTCVWLESSVRKRLLNQLKSVPPADLSTEYVLAAYDRLKTAMPKKKDVLVERLDAILTGQGIEPELVKRIKNLVKSDSEIAGCVAK